MTKGCKHDSFYLQALFTQNYGFNRIRQTVTVNELKYYGYSVCYKITENTSRVIIAIKLEYLLAWAILKEQQA